MKQEQFTRQEVVVLLKRQIKASAASYGRMICNPDLMRNGPYQKENIEVHKRLNKVRTIKF